MTNGTLEDLFDPKEISAQLHAIKRKMDPIVLAGLENPTGLAVVIPKARTDMSEEDKNLPGAVILVGGLPKARVNVTNDTIEVKRF